MDKIIFILGIVLISKFALAEDVYNFYFQRSPGMNAVVQNSSGQSVGLTPATTVPVTAVTPTTVEKKSYWKVGIGHGYDLDSYAMITGLLLNVGYNFNKYFGISASYLKDDNIERLNWEAHGDPTLDKFDFGGHVTPISLNAFGFDLFEISVMGGMASVHSIIGTENEPRVVNRDYKPYLGLAVNFNFTKNFGLEAFNKFQADDIRSSDRPNPYRFNFAGATLTWRI